MYCISLLAYLSDSGLVYLSLLISNLISVLFRTPCFIIQYQCLLC